jgi:RNA methyltransferase, TrmH family
VAAAAGFHSSQVRAARQLHEKKHRAQARCFLIEGPALLDAALATGHVPSAVFFVPGASVALDDAAAQAESSGAPSFAVDARTLDSLSQTRAPQGLVAQLPFLDRSVADLGAVLPAAPAPALALILHDIDDPGNAGTLVRSAEAFGAGVVCFGPTSVEPYNDKLVRASMGALFRVAIVRYGDWLQLASALASAGLTIVGAKAGASDIRSVSLPGRAALVLGNERHGLQGIPATAGAIEVGIPQKPAGDSLNVAMAGSILLYELARAAKIL